MIVPARWDTDNFYIKVGNLIAEGGLNKSFLLREMAHAREEHYDLLYLKGVNLPCDCLSENVILADEKVVYVQVNSGRETPVDDERVASALNSPLTEELLQLSYESENTHAIVWMRTSRSPYSIRCIDYGLYVR